MAIIKRNAGRWSLAANWLTSTLKGVEQAAAQTLSDTYDENSEAQKADSMSLPTPAREYQQRLSAVQAIVADDAERVAQVVRRWVRDSE